MISVETIDSLKQVDPLDWDRVASRHVFACHGLLSTMEDTSLTYHPRYYLARDTWGITAVAPCYLGYSQRDVDGLDQLLFGRLSKLPPMLRLSVAPTLVCGPRFGITSNVLIDPNRNSEDHRRITEKVIDAMVEDARNNSWTLCFTNVIDKSTPLSETLRARRFGRALDLPAMVLNLRWKSFDDYLRGLRDMHPSTVKGIKWERRRARKVGLDVLPDWDPSTDLRVAHKLLDDHYRRLNGAPFPYHQKFLETLLRRMGNKLVFYTAVHANTLLGVAVGFRGEGSIALSMLGVVQPASRAKAVYFNTCYNQPIEDAIANGIERLFMGKLLYDVKARRGLEMLPLHVYVRFPSRLRQSLVQPAFSYQVRILTARHRHLPVVQEDLRRAP
ncbi:MAG: peptidogalycan biosysnthesis protein [Gammaproteobacteria bacterium]|nr:peptidogalycan biosysnthesis protein [Gammaproteobacteria bacterium]